MKLWAILPELVLAGLCLGLVPVAGFARGRWRALPGVVVASGLVACLVLTARMLPWAPVAVFEGTYAVDGFSCVFKLMIFAGSLLTLFVLGAYFRGKTQVAHAPVAVLFATLGSVGLASSLDLGLIVLFLQMLSMAIYVLCALIRSDFRALEAAIKYFIYGAVALAIMAYGLTFLYGMTGSLDLRVIRAALASGGGDPLWVGLALFMVLAGYGFEMTMVPFHPWAPDVFEGATAPIAGFVSVVPKIAAFAGLLRFLVQGLPVDPSHWPLIVAVLAVLTMTLGNLVALWQFSLKRLLAYSSIAQAGYVLMAVAVAESTGRALPAAGYYLAAFLFMNLGAFAVVSHLERTLGSDSFEALRGLHERAPGPAAVLAVSLLSLAGFPPLAGFAGKVVVLGAAMDGGMTWLAVIGIVNMAVAVYYYARVLMEMYMRDPVYDYPLPRRLGFTLTYGLALAGTILLGVVPGPVLAVMQALTELLR
jgi:NADH-quinone oxidoreductase subunit N